MRNLNQVLLIADGDDFFLLLDALQIQVHVEKGHGELEGIIPDYAPRNSHAGVWRQILAGRESHISLRRTGPQST